MRTLLLACVTALGAAGSSACNRSSSLASSATGDAAVSQASSDASGQPQIAQRPGGQDAAAVLDGVLRELENSGPAGDASRLAAAALAEVRRAAPPGVAISATDDCYAAGCTALAALDRGGDLHKQQKSLMNLIKQHWNGSAFVSAPRTSGDGSVATMVVYTHIQRR
jgi:hypothetical protein